MIDVDKCDTARGGSHQGLRETRKEVERDRTFAALHGHKGHQYRIASPSLMSRGALLHRQRRYQSATKWTHEVEGRLYNVNL